MRELRITELFPSGGSMLLEELYKTRYPWDILPCLGDIILRLGESLDPVEYVSPGRGIWISRSARLSPTAEINAPAIISHGSEVRHSAFIRGGVIVGEGAVIGNSSEIKNSVIFDGCQIPHFNYVGDSILGRGAHLGAGAVTSNVKTDRSEVAVRAGEVEIKTGLRKLGAVIGEGAEIGCGAVIAPGAIIGRGARIYPQCFVRGFVPREHILKSDGSLVPINN